MAEREQRGGGGRRPIIGIMGAGQASSVKAPGRRLFSADAPIDVVRLIEEDLAIPRWSP